MDGFTTKYKKNTGKKSQTGSFRPCDKGKGSSEAHTILLNEVLLELGKQCGDLCRVWRNETGMALNMRTERPFHYGLVGSSDILGIVRGGFLIGIEIKTGEAIQSAQQKRFQEMITRFGGFYHVARSVQSAVDFIKGLTSEL